MRIWRFWFSTLVLSSQYNPPWFIELLMTALAMVLLVRWGVTDDKLHNWPFMVLSSSFAIGAATSISVRELITPHPILACCQWLLRC